MLIYVYDGCFEGLLTAIYTAYYSGRFPDRLESRINLQQSLLDEYVHIAAEPDKADRVYASIRYKISGEALAHVYNVFLSEAPDAGTLIYEYLHFGWKVGGRVDLYLTDDRVFKVHEISRRVGLETHRLLGFVRFSLLEGNIYYAPIQPDYNQVELLAPHFAERLSDQDWIIHDVRRNVAALFNKAEWLVTQFTVDELPAAASEELEYRKLWKGFFDTIAIRSRNNPGLQRQLMPRRYWKYMTEKS